MTTFMLCLLFLLIGMFLDHYIFIPSFRESVNKGIVSGLNGLDRFMGVKGKKANPGGGADISKPQLSILEALKVNSMTAADLAFHSEPKMTLPAIVNHIDTLMARNLVEHKGSMETEAGLRSVYHLTAAGKKFMKQQGKEAAQ
jgi:DNA-binding MarR family transcriptional regulator